MPAGAALPPRHDAGAFKAIIVIEQAASPDWRNAVCDWLVRSRCLYAMTWGHECSVWHDCVDEASLAMHNFEDTSEDDHVMTTWHENEPVDNVFWYSEFCAAHPTIEIFSTLIVDVTVTSRRDDLISRYAKAIQKIPP